MEKADLAQTPVIVEPKPAPENPKSAETPRNNDGMEVLETREWMDSLDYVLARGGPVRAGRGGDPVPGRGTGAAGPVP